MWNWLKRGCVVGAVLAFGGSLFAAGMDQGDVAHAPAVSPSAPGVVSDPHGVDPHAGMAPVAGPMLPSAPPTVMSANGSGGMAVGDVDDRVEFQSRVKLDAFRRLAILHMDQVKILDSWARQCLGTIRNHQTIDGQDPLYTALDICFRRSVWENRNIIYVQAVPIREQFAHLVSGGNTNSVEGDRIMHTGLVSYGFLERQDVQDQLTTLSRNVIYSQAVGKVQEAHDLFKFMGWTLLIVAPPTESAVSAAGLAPGAENPAKGSWHHPVDILANVADPVAAAKEFSIEQHPRVPGYTTEQAEAVRKGLEDLVIGWGQGDAEMANKGIGALVAELPTINPGAYPTETKRDVELVYNKTFYGTIANVFLYFICMTLFLMVAVGVTRKVEGVALAVFALAVITHVAAMGVRWWLAGRIPIQNQFESVLGSAMIGCVIGLILELWKKNGLFGAAFSFVGFLAMTACFSCQYVFGKDIGGAVGKVKGILADYWLYIHVNIVISSYALIAASFLMGILYLGVKLWFWVNPVENEEFGGRQEAEGSRQMGDSGGIGAMVASETVVAPAVLTASRLKLLDGLDAANMVILQMAFWFLGTGIICGAVWADHSWGRPWGWDPKETFALVTWIVYLIIVHVRFVTKAKADATAWLSVVGFGVMMFNWIGVNFWLVGLHSYA